jgi:hypothetical protein
MGTQPPCHAWSGWGYGWVSELGENDMADGGTARGAWVSLIPRHGTDRPWLDLHEIVFQKRVGEGNAEKQVIFPG